MKQKETLTQKDKELIDLAQSTTYTDTIEQCIEDADTELAKRILTNILNTSDTEWDDEWPRRR